MGGRQSSIDRLPPDILERLQELLRDPRVTQLDATIRINEILETEGHPERVSKSAVNRYDMEMRKVGEKLRQSREVAEMWIGKLGAAPQGKLGNLINETLRTLAFDVTLKLQEGELTGESLPDVIHQLKGLALAVQRLEASATLSVKREADIRRQALEEAASAIGETAAQAGVSPETIQKIRRDVLRMAA
ncbi:MAG: DUF3486 family protein [Desulfobulbus sp.]|jgi:hypothetical protein|uniref:DUF3486 family protein n=1 Tax=Desulfobulbus sp. TaxID=895 RepID=UPI00284E7B0D|nr:DUF3486 family protein [Desulfobulbus sp.]MDR2551440.1 DUF3486 family protein [Desulfobulbus sp.]